MKSLIVSLIVLVSAQSYASDVRCFAVVTGDKDDLKVEMTKKDNQFTAELGSYSFSATIGAKQNLEYQIKSAENWTVAQSKNIKLPTANTPAILTVGSGPDIVDIACYLVQ